MAGVVCRTVNRIISSQASCSSSSVVPVRNSLWFTSVLSIQTSAPLRAEPRKKKKVDPRREMMIKERLKKKLKRMEKVAAEMIPIEDFITSAKSFDDKRIREPPKLSFEESERRALLLKEWSRYKHAQHLREMDVIKEALEAQRQALDELKLESEELYKAAVSPDMSTFPFQHQGPCYTPPIANYEAPEGKYNDITRVYTQ